jgi:fibro-slime domain-containing protein
MSKKLSRATRVALPAILSFLAGYAPASALSITGTYTNIDFGSPGTGGDITELKTGLVGALGSPLVNGFPATNGIGNNFWSTAGIGVSNDAIGTRIDNPSGLTLNFPADFFPSGKQSDSEKYLAVHWTAAFSNTAPVKFFLAADDHAFLYIDGKLVLDAGGSKRLATAPVDTEFSLVGTHTLDLFFADIHVVQSGITFACEGCDTVGGGVDDPATPAPEPTTLVLFGTGLVGIGAMLRRRLTVARRLGVVVPR